MDLSSDIPVGHIIYTTPSYLSVRQGEPVARFRSIQRIPLTPAIQQILFDDSGEHLLVSTGTGHHIYYTEDSSFFKTTALTSLGPNDYWIRSPRSKSRSKWAALPSSSYPERFAHLNRQTLTTYSVKEPVQGCAILDVMQQYKLCYPEEQGTSVGVIKSLTFSPHGRSVVAAVSQTTSTRYSGQAYFGQLSDESGYSIYVFHLDNIDEGNLVSPSRSVPSSICREPIGMSQDGNRFLFQHANNWVWSFDPNGGNGEYTQHFPVPLEFILGDK